MSNSRNLQLPYVAASQSQKHVTVNESLRRIDAAVQLSVIDRTHTAPPVGPAEGDRYIVAVNATDAWQGQAYNVAAFIDGAWAFFTPQQGWLCYIAAEHSLFVYDGSAWILATELNGFDTVSQFGVNASADSNNRLVVKAAASLFEADAAGGSGGDVRVVLSKTETEDTASHLFQNNFSGRAEFGLIGSDNFSIKVSPNGSNFTEALRVNADDAVVNFPFFPTVAGEQVFTIAAASVTAAEGTNIPSNTQRLEVRGYAAENDGGAAIYQRATSEPAHNGKFQSADGAWWDLISIAEGVDVRVFGAKCDGVTDDTDAIEHALAAGKGPVIVPEGVTRISNLMFPANGTLRGVSRDRSILRVTDTGSTGMNGSGSSNIVIENLTFDGNRGVVASGNTIILGDQNDIVIRNIVVVNAASYGIVLRDGSTSRATISDIIVQNCGNSAIDIRDINYTSEDNLLMNVVVDTFGLNSSNVSGINIRGPWKCSNIVVKGLQDGGTGVSFRPDNEPDGNGGHGATLTNFRVIGSGEVARAEKGVHIRSRDVTVSNGYVEGCAIAGIRVFDERCTVSNINVEGSADPATGYGYFTSSAAVGCEFSNCAAKECTRSFNVLSERSSYVGCSSTDATVSPLVVDAQGDGNQFVSFVSTGSSEAQIDGANTTLLASHGLAVPGGALDVRGFNAMSLFGRSTDPSDPAEGEAVLWMPNGTGTNADGSIFAKTTVGGNTESFLLGAPHATIRNASDFGAAPSNAAAANDSAFADAIAWLNAGAYRVLKIDPGLFDISTAFPTITGSQKALIGTHFATILRMDAGETNNAFLKIGDGTAASAARVFVSGLQLQAQNESTAASGYAIELDGASDTYISDIRFIKVPQVLMVGATAKVSRPVFSNFTGTYNGSADRTIYRFQRWTGVKVLDFKLHGTLMNGNARTAATYDLSPVETCDTFHAIRCSGFHDDSARYAIYAKIDDGDAVNVWFKDCVFDKHGVGGAAVRILSSSSSNSSSSLRSYARNWWFTNCRFDTGGDNNGGRGVHISQNSSTGYSEISDINFQGCMFTYRDDAAVDLDQSGSDRMYNIQFQGCNFDEAAAGLTINSVIEVGVSGVIVQGCSNGFNESGYSSNTDAFIRVTSSDANDIVVANNLLNAASVLIRHPSGGYQTVNMSRRIANNVIGARPVFAIAGGDITLEGVEDEGFVEVDTQGGASTDDLDNIFGAHRDGQRITLSAADNSHTVSVTRNGNIDLVSDPSELTHSRDRLTLEWSERLGAWLELGFKDLQS